MEVRHCLPSDLPAPAGDVPMHGPPAARRRPASVPAAHLRPATAALSYLPTGPACSEADRGEAELAALWDGYERALQCDREVGAEVPC